MKLRAKAIIVRGWGMGRCIKTPKVVSEGMGRRTRAGKHLEYGTGGRTNVTKVVGRVDNKVLHGVDILPILLHTPRTSLFET